MKLKLVLASFLVLAICLPAVTLYHHEAEAVDGYHVHNLNTTMNYTTIQEAINADGTLDGHVILVDAGTYFENVVVNKSLSLVGESRETTIIDGENKGIVVNVTANSVVIAHFTVRNSGAYYPNSSICLCGTDFTSVTDNVIEQSNYGILLLSSYNTTINGNQIADNLSHGIVMNSSCNSTVNGNNLTRNDAEAFNLFQSNRNFISENNVSTNAAAVWMDGSFYNVFSNNRMHNCTVSFLPVIALANSEGNWFVENDINNFDNSGTGFALYSSNESFIIENNIENCDYGLYLSSSNHNRIYHNNIVNNVHQAYIYEASAENSWDDGYPSGGNYWSEYVGADYFQGSAQNISGSDGIGEAEYSIGVDNTDRYPLKGMFSCFNATSELHVQAICNSTISNFQYNGTALMFSVTGVDETAGFCRICVPTSLMNASYRVFVNGTEVTSNLLLCSNSTHSYLYFNYTHSTQEVIVIPEFPMLLVLHLFFIATLIAATIYRRKHPQDM